MPVLNQQSLLAALEQLQLVPFASGAGLTAEKLQELLRRQFHILAFELHPDRNGGSEEALRRFQQVKESYDFLRQSLKDAPAALLSLLADQDRQQAVESAYLLYKQASRNYNQALEQYFMRAKQVNLSAGNSSYLRLARALRAIKAQFGEVLKLDPGGVWAGDCIDKISRINVWLKGT